jgi:hypothetical protein
MRSLRRSVALLAALLASALPSVVCPTPLAHAATAAASTPSRGRPVVKLDRLTLPALADADKIERHLRQVLKREAHKANWGAGRGSVIEYRFKVEELTVVNQSGVLSVTCSAAGRLPKGQAARSRLVYGGKPSEREKLVEHVLDIVARGVITRLAEMERIRRGGR